METFTRRFGIALSSGLIAACTAWAMFAVINLSFITAIVALGLALVCLFLIALLAASKDVVAQGVHDSTGTLLHPDRRIDNNLRRVVIIGALSMALMFTMWAVDLLYLPFPDGVRQVFPISFGAGALVLLWAWWKMSMRGGLSYLMLTPDYFEFTSLWSLKFGEWNDIASIADKLPTEERFWNPMVVTMRDGGTLIMEAPGIYTPNGTALIEMVRFYWQHPERRSELTDGRALERLQPSVAHTDGDAAP